MESMWGVLGLVEQIAAIGVVIACLEWLFYSRPLRDEGFFSWAVFRTRAVWMFDGVVGRIFSALFSFRATVFLLIVRLFSAITLFMLATVPGNSGEYVAVVIIVAISGMLFRFRVPIGADGSDQLSSIIFCSSAVARLANSAIAIHAALWFLTAQACLAYFTSGTLKATSRGWMNGSFLGRVWSTDTYGWPVFARLVGERSFIALMVSWSFIGWETLFLVVLFVPDWVGVPFIAFGVVFHLGTAVVMGLNTFFWSFVATYPAILWCVWGVQVWRG
jgi:hypothetical protein